MSLETKPIATDLPAGPAAKRRAADPADGRGPEGTALVAGQEQAPVDGQVFHDAAEAAALGGNGMAVGRLPLSAESHPSHDAPASVDVLPPAENSAAAHDASLTPDTPPADDAHDPADDLPLTVIERRPGWKFLDLAEMWRYRELLYFLVWRDVKVRYKQTVLGAAWAVLQPLATMVVFSLFFGRVAGMGDTLDPYPLFVYAGLLPWSFFATAVSQAGQSIVGSQNLVTKVYFPRLFIPLGAIGAALVDFAVAFVLLVGLMCWYGVWPGPGLLLAPLLVLLLLLAATAVGTLLATLTVAYRDFRYTVPFMVQLWMFCTPTIYMDAARALGERWQWLLPLNPVYGVIANFRAAMLGDPLDWYALAVSTAVAAVLFLAGAMYFRRVERSFADII